MDIEGVDMTRRPGLRATVALPTFAELESLDWASLDSCYDEADQIPARFRALYRCAPDDVDGRWEVLDELLGCLTHQGTVYEATAPAISFLARAALDMTGAARIEMLGSLVLLSDQRHNDYAEADAVRETLADVVPHLMSLLDDEDPEARCLMVRLLAAVDEGDRDAAIARLVEILAEDADASTRADAVSVLSVLDSPSTMAGREAALLRDVDPLVRASAALASAERTGPPYRPEVVDSLADHGLRLWSQTGFRGHVALDDDVTRLQSVLEADVDAGIATARRWVATGNIDRGTYLATDMAKQWRDRESAIVPILVDALPGLSGRSLASVLNTIAWLIPQAPEAFVLCERVSEWLFASDEGVAQAAGLVLARCGDLRVLETARSISPLALGALGGRAEAVPHIIQALRTPTDRMSEMCKMLPDATLVTLLPHLIELLREKISIYNVAWMLIRVHESATDPELPELLQAASTSESAGAVNGALAVAHALLTGDATQATHLLAATLDTDKDALWHLPLAAELGSAAAPLLPLTERHLRWAPRRNRPGPGELRVDAVIARWKIGGDADRAVADLAEAIRTSRYGTAKAMETLAEIDRPVPDTLRPMLRYFAWSPHRIEEMHWARRLPHPDERLRSAAFRLLGMTGRRTLGTL